MIYLDNAATTRVCKEVIDVINIYLYENYANPSSSYQFALKVNQVIEKTNYTIAKFLNAKSNEIYYTSGGSESNNWVLKMVSEHLEGKHIITSCIEHHSILNTCHYLEFKGYEITYLSVDENGLIDLNELKSAIRQDTILISIMTANNEIGTIQPIKEIGRIAKEHHILFHTDAVQAFGHIPLDVEDMNIDFLSASAHKLHGPKGIGLLYMRNGIEIKPLIHGGSQQRNKRAGTYNVPAIAGFEKAVYLTAKNLSKQSQYEIELRDYFIERLENEIKKVHLNGHSSKRLPNNIHISFEGVNNQSLAILLDKKGICVSTGSACTSASSSSHVLKAIGIYENDYLRFSLSYLNSKEEIDEVIEILKVLVEKLRKGGIKC